MSGQKMAYVSIDSIVNDYLEESEQSQHKYSKCWQLCFRGMDEMGLDFFYAIRSLKLPVLSNNTVKLPPDFLQYTKVGILNAKGEIFQLQYNNKLTFFGVGLPNRKQVSEVNTILVDWYSVNSPYFFNYWEGDFYTTLYGLPSGGVYAGSFNVDLPNGIILLNEFREALIAWLWWKDKKASTTKRGQVGIARDLERNFYNERRKAQARFRPLYLEQAYQLNLESERITVKA